jgi:hypothetical protein
MDTNRYARYKQMLFAKGFSEAKKKSGRFFRQATEQTAFVVNLEDDGENCATILYGFASTAYMIGDEEWFSNHGSDAEECQVRNICCIYDENTENENGESILQFYNQYKDYSKAEILAVKKERQKAFLAHFARALKPLGFKKKGTRWSRTIDGERTLSFDAQKSAYSDQYYFNITIHNPSDYYSAFSHERVVMCGRNIYNWQLMTDEQIENLIEFTLKTYIEPILS